MLFRFFENFLRSPLKKKEQTRNLLTFVLKIIKDALKNLHDRYIFTPINKVDCNVAHVCKIFYVLTLFREHKQLTKKTYESC